MNDAIKLQRHLDRATNKVRAHKEFQQMAREAQEAKQTKLIDAIKEGIEETNENM